MKKKIHSKNTLIFFLCLLLHLSIQAQNHKYFIITGKIVSDSAFIESVSVHIIKNDKPAIVSEIPEHGRFRLELDYNAEYQLTFVQKGFLSKTIHVNTEIPVDVNNCQTNLPHFLMSVRLYKDTQDARNLYVGNLIQQIKYSPDDNNFTRTSTIFDLEYVDKGSVIQTQSTHLQESKTKLNNNQIF
jgi:hypothetical protein